MEKSHILHAGGHQAGGTVLPFCGPDGLHEMLRHAHYHYYTEVVQDKGSYELFKIGFINGHQHHDETDARSKNEHGTNHAIVKHLLEEHRSIIEEVFSSEYEQDYLSIQAQVFKPDKQLMYKLPPSHTTEEVSSLVGGDILPSFNQHISLDMVKVITKCANEIGLFHGGLEMEDFMAFLDGIVKPGKKFVSTNNRMVAYFFHTISVHGIICHEWQNVIDKRGLVWRPKGDSTLRQGDLASALNKLQYADTKPGYYHRIDKMGEQLKALVKSAKHD